MIQALFSSRAARVLAAAGLVASIAMLFVVQAWETRLRADRMVGMLLQQGDGGVRIERVAEDFPAARAGVRGGDRLEAVDGYVLEKPIDYDTAAAAFERGRSVTFRLVRDGRTLEAEVVPGTELPLFQLVLDAVALAGYLGIALLALFQAPGDLRARLLFLFCAAVAFELALPYEAIGSPVLSVVALTAYYLVTGLEVGVELHLASVIPRPYRWLKRRRWLVPTYYLLGMALGGVVAATYVAEDGLGIDLFPWSSMGAERVFLGLGFPLWALAVPAILALQVARADEPRGRHQAGLVLAGVIPWTVYVLLLSVYSFEGVEVPSMLQALEALALLAYPVAVFVAIYRYQLFDIELAMRRGLLYTTLTGGLVLAFYAALGAGSALFSSLLHQGRSVWFIAGATLALGLIFAPMRRALQRLIDRKFFPERHALRERLIRLAEELPGEGKLPLMGEHLAARLEGIFGVRSATILLADAQSGLLVPLATSRNGGAEDPDFLVERTDPAVGILRRAGRPLTPEQLADQVGAPVHGPPAGASVAAPGAEAGPGRSPAAGQSLLLRLRALGAAVAAPLLVRGELIGLLILGRRKGGERFPGEEVELLNLLCHHVATVFQNAHLFESATYESLTGLLRREAILETLERELERAKRYQRPLVVAMADLDHFKRVNDRHGHLAGDALLKRVAQALGSGLRSTDALGRYGGEEFLLVLPETGIEGGRAVADKLRRQVEEVRAPMPTGEEASVTVSIGLASVDDPELPEDPTVRDLISLADRALYRAKEEGRNRVYPDGLVSAAG